MYVEGEEEAKLGTGGALQLSPALDPPGGSGRNTAVRSHLMTCLMSLEVDSPRNGYDLEPGGPLLKHTLRDLRAGGGLLTSL